MAIGPITRTITWNHCMRRSTVRGKPEMERRFEALLRRCTPYFLPLASRLCNKPSNRIASAIRRANRGTRGPSLSLVHGAARASGAVVPPVGQSSNRSQVSQQEVGAAGAYRECEGGRLENL